MSDLSTSKSQDATAKNNSYQTYTIPMTGVKRKRAPSVDDSGSTEDDDGRLQRRSKKGRHKSDPYNPKYMAEMCFSAYTSRLHTAGTTGYPRDITDDYRQDLVDMFAHAHSKGSFRPGAAARHMIPRLATITPRSNSDKVALVKEFIGHYNVVKCDLLSIGEIKASSGQPNADFASTARRYLAGLHRTLAKAAKWRNIIPYTPLPKSNLQSLRDLTTHPKHYQLFGDLTGDISDIEGWLSLPPPLLEFSAGLRASVIENLQKETAKEAGKAKAGISTEKSVNDPATTNFEVQEAKHQRPRDDQARSQDAVLREAAQQTQAEREQTLERIKTLEEAAAQQSRESSLLRSRETAAATEREKKYSDQNAQHTREIERLDAALAAEKAKTAAIGARVAQMSEEASNRMDVSMISSSNGAPTTNISFQSSQGTLGTYFGSSFGSSTYNNANNQSHLFQQNTKIPPPHDSPTSMEDARDISFDNEPFRGGLPNLHHPYPFTHHVPNNDTAQPNPGSNESFKETCPDFKMGRCRAGRRCRLPHTACRFWLKGNCTNGSDCYRSHDPWFLSQQNALGERMVIDSEPQRGPKGSRHTGQRGGVDSVPLGPNHAVPIAERVTRDTPSVFAQPQPLHSPIFGNGHTVEPASGAPSPSPVPSAPKIPLAQRTTKNGRPVTSAPTPTSPFSTPFSTLFFTPQNYHNNSTSNGTFNSTPSQPHPPNPPQKQACRDHLEVTCTRGLYCKFAHKPCPQFMRGACRFDEQTCRRSHDGAFLVRAGGRDGVGMGQQQQQQQERRKPRFGQQDDMERGLDDILGFGGGRSQRSRAGARRGFGGSGNSSSGSDEMETHTGRQNHHRQQRPQFGQQTGMENGLSAESATSKR